MVGDEDAPRIEPALLMKQMIPRSGLAIIPQTGHTINLEEPELFNQMVLRFLTLVEAGTWA
jgi:pimeloyl-ACP methyl ester carboxylesterase